ncbi:MAG TPA: hypothetical protein PLQ57_05645 [Saprospiraceae bacterium]|nr:hypothetical protein [Saprospiraceae bacterium]HRG64524.1 hypothetical protein [Saprospiraceae bacterium]
MRSNRFLGVVSALLIVAMVFTSGCVSRKRKNEVSKVGKFYHNVTSEYNGYFNANELYEASLLTLREKNNDNYSKILEVYDYIAVPDPKIVNADLDKAIEKLTRVAAIHEPGDWVDNCYVLMAKAQYLKQDYERALETLEYFEEDFNPVNPYGRNFQKKKMSSKQKKAESEAKREEEKKKREAAKEIVAKDREEEKKAKEEAKKDLKKKREEEKKARDKQREQEKKEREKQKKRGKRTTKTKTEVKTDSLTNQPANKTTPTGPSNINKPAEQPSVKKTEEEVVEAPETAPQAKKDKKDNTSYSEGLVWLAKTYTRTEQYSNAEFLLKNLEKTPGIKEEVLDEINPAMADLMIKQKDYEPALVYLDKAIEGNGRKNDKARYAYIAGQIHRLRKNPAVASDYFLKAKNNAKDFKLKFMSELAYATTLAAKSNGGPEATVRQLEKFLKEDKYREFRDQIYFSLGETVLPTDKAKAKEYFLESSKNNNNNVSLKTETAYYLATLHLDEKIYQKSKVYFDSTLINLPKTDERYFYVKNMAENLSSIAKNAQIVERLDSLLAMGELSTDELKKIAKRRLEAERKAGKAEEQSVGAKQGLFTNPSKGTGSGFSNFFAYSLSAVEAGKNSFKNTWGSRKSEDNWRRSNKSYNQADTDPVAEQNAGANESADVTDAEYKRIMADVPLNSFQKEQYRTEMRKALYGLGKDYRDKIQEYQLSIDVLEKLIQDYPGNENEAEVYYYLYLNYTDLNNTAMADKYKALLLSKYPDDKFTKIASDANYLAALSADAKRLDLYYDQSYDLFQKGQYDKVSGRIQNAIDAFGKENKLMAKFSLLNAMCLGATQGKDAYINALKEVVVRYPKTPEELKAKEIMRFLVGDATAFDQVDPKEVDKTYELENDSRHYVAVIILTGDSEPFENAKIAVSDYNKQFHGIENLQLGENILSKEEKTQLILVRSFDNSAKAMRYYEGVQKSRDLFIPPAIAGFEILPITTRNYRKMMQDKTHSKYRAFFEKNYLNK